MEDKDYTNSLSVMDRSLMQWYLDNLSVEGLKQLCQILIKNPDPDSREKIESSITEWNRQYRV